MNHFDKLLMQVEQSRAEILSHVEGANDITFIRSYGNIGDHLIYAGTRQLLRDVTYREISVLDLDRDSGGHTALLAGSGAWCGPYHQMPAFLRSAEQRFERVIVLPSSFDTSLPSVRDAVTNSRAHFFARERKSLLHLNGLCSPSLAHDCAFFFDFEPYSRPGAGTLNAFRTDPEAAYRDVPEDNTDLSNECESLDELIWTIARHELIRTDRAHVLIPALVLGKRVEYRESSYHKVPGIVAYAFDGFPVERIVSADSDNGDEYRSSTGGKANRYIWGERVRKAASELSTLIPDKNAVVLADDNQIGRLDKHHEWIPFIERNGLSWGPPADNEMAIRELERLRSLGASTFVLAWPAFWWRDSYPLFIDYLHRTYDLILESEHVVAFRLGRSTQSDE